MSKPVVIYFELKGRAEPIRLILAYAGQDFEDRRISKKDWPEYKPKTPLGQLPLLEIDGKVYAHSLPIVRYLAKKYGLAGKNIEEELEIDQNVNTFNDLIEKAYQIFFEMDPEKKKKKLEDGDFKFLLDKFNEIVEKNNGHVALGKLTYGDFIFAGFYYALAFFEIKDFDTKYPALAKLHDSVYCLPGVKEFAQNAPPDRYYS